MISSPAGKMKSKGAEAYCMADKERRERAKPFYEAFVHQGLPSTSILLVGDEGYEASRNSHFNLDMICFPLLFVVPSNTTEVSMAVRGYAQGLKVWKGNHPESIGIPPQSTTREAYPKLCISSGRHSTRAFKDECVILDLRMLQETQVDPDSQTVTVGGGVKIETMLEALAPFHLAAVTGTHKDTGVVGLTLGGGQGFISKKFGPAVDQIISAEIVLADGSLRTVVCDKPEDEDIMFNIRGGGGNVGVITKLTMKVYPVRNLAFLDIVNFVFTQKGVESAVLNYGEWSLSAPDDCTSLLILPLGSPVVVVVGISCNEKNIRQDVEASVAASNFNVAETPGLADLKKNGVGAWFRLPAKLKVKDYNTEAMEATSADKPGHLYYTNIFIPCVTPTIAAILAEAQRGIVGKGISGAVLLFNHAGKKTAEVPSGDTAFEMRDKKYWLLCQTTWIVTGDKEKDLAAREKVQRFNRWFRQELVKAGAQRTIHAVTDMEKDFDADSDYGLFFRDMNKHRMIQTQKALDPDGIFSVNHTVE